MTARRLVRPGDLLSGEVTHVSSATEAHVSERWAQSPSELGAVPVPSDVRKGVPKSVLPYIDLRDGKGANAVSLASRES